MKVVKVIGGLGNQMFQYAFYLQQKLYPENIPTLLDIKAFQKYKLHNGYEIENIFKNADNNYATDKDLKKLFGIYYYFGKLSNKSSKYIKQKNFGYDNKYLEMTSGYFNGYWQSEKFFKNIENDLRSHFGFSDIDNKNRELYQQIKDKNTISIHVRRGDYINHPVHGGICDLDYYNKAINYCLNNINECHFVMFSNDIEWCKANLNIDNVSYVDWNNNNSSYRDMQLMSLCKNNIIANSSFSWWGAWLNENPNKTVIAPNKWFNDDSINQKDICPSKWLRIE